MVRIRLVVIMTCLLGCNRAPKGYMSSCDPVDGGCGGELSCVETNPAPEEGRHLCLVACNSDDECEFDRGCSTCSDTGFCIRHECQ